MTDPVVVSLDLSSYQRSSLSEALNHYLRLTADMVPEEEQELEELLRKRRTAFTVKNRLASL